MSESNGRLICVTNRQLCREPFLERIAKLAQARPYAIMLREKDLAPAAYERLACQVKAICDRYQVRLIAHQHLAIAETIGLAHLQLSMPALRAASPVGRHLAVGASVHAVAEAVEAEALGAAYLVAGHIFATDSKKGLAPRGLSFLRQVCQAVNLPVFAIGGIEAANAGAVIGCGASGFCIMSSAMTCEDPAALVREFLRAAPGTSPS